MHAGRATTLAACLVIVLSSGGRAAEPSVREFWQLLEQIGAVLVSVSSLGEGEVHEGAIWLTDLATGRRHAVAPEPIYAYPVLEADGALVALSNHNLVRIDGATGQARTIASDVHLRKLIGVAPDGTILALADEGALGRPALVSPSGEVSLSAAPDSRKERRDVAILNNESRAYVGDRGLIVDRSDHGFDVFLMTAGGRRNLTNCGTDACGQPALSNDGRQVVYIRSVAAR
jgi:hypothetical protein